MVEHLWIIPAAPLAGALLNGLSSLFFARRHGQAPHALTALIGIGAVATSFVVTVLAFLELRGLPEGSALSLQLWNWIEAGPLTVRIGLAMDALTAVMLLFITFVAGLIHIYSVGYMHEDPGFSKFFTYLNLFVFSMIILVLGDSLPLLFVGWEGVGLCSFLLISFWYDDPEKVEAGKKAFITNRIGDAGFLLAMFVLFGVAGTLSISELQARQNLFGPGVATAICLLLMVGAAGKSAQLPLFVWLPDAMAGPTPVSALIHAATMVTAGVYLVARMHFLFALSPLASTVVATVGVVTAFFAATIALGQYDIKKVLAYSTISQLGYMFLGVGVGAYSAGIFHVMTHAFFKACLFLGAGSVIHALHHEQDLRNMGGLLKKIPVTAVTFLVAWLAIAGLPPFAGFFSKDEILWKALATRNVIHPALPAFFFGLGLLTALLTAFYMTRLVVLTFFGSYRGHAHEVKEHGLMTVPLVILAFFSATVGFLGIPHVLGGHNLIEHFLGAVTGISTPVADGAPHELELPLMALSVGIAIVGVLGAFWVFLWSPAVGDALARAFAFFGRLFERKYYVDEIYEAVLLKPFRAASDLIAFRFVDGTVIEGSIRGLVAAAYGVGGALRSLQNGQVRAYLAYIFVGVVLLLWIAFGNITFN